MKKNYSLIIFLCIQGLYSCHKNNVTPVDSKVDVYVAGYEWNGNSTNFVAKYWKNGTAVNLTDGSQNALAYSITVSGNDVYVAGNEGNTAKYWKNGIPVTLGDTAANTSDTVKTYAANSITVPGNDVYVTGYMAWTVKMPVIPGQRGSGYRGGSITLYWKNGIPVDLFVANGFASQATGIAVSGNDVYVSGYSTNGLTSTAIYWKNGIETGVGSQTSSASSIAVSGNDVYLAGSILSSDGKKDFATYWKNGIAVTLGSDTAYEDGATAIAVSGNDVYVAGYEWDYGSPQISGNVYVTYWKNNSKVKLAIGNAYAIAVSENDVYVAGTFNNGVVNGAGSNSIAAYWKNGIEVPLSDGTKLEEVAYSICVAKQ